MVFLGDASYSMYILHIPVSLWWKWVATKVLGLSLPPLLNFAVMVALVIGIAALNQAYLEPRFRRWLLRRRARSPLEHDRAPGQGQQQQTLDRVADAIGFAGVDQILQHDEQSDYKQRKNPVGRLPLPAQVS